MISTGFLERFSVNDNFKLLLNMSNTLLRDFDKNIIFLSLFISLLSFTLLEGENSLIVSSIAFSVGIYLFKKMNKTTQVVLSIIFTISLTKFIIPSIFVQAVLNFIYIIIAFKLSKVIFKSESNENNLNVEILNLSLMEPSDLLGMPDVDKSQERPRTIWLEPEWFQRIVDKAWPINFTFEDLEFNDLEFKEVVINKFKNNIENIENIKRKDLNGLYCSYYKTTEGILSNQNNVRCEKSQKSILFLDELNRASPDTRQPALQLTLDKKLQCHELPYVDGKCTFIVSAINPSDLYQTDDLDTALLDRFLLVDLEVSVQDWLKYATSREIVPSIIEFITENPDRLHFMPEEGKGSSPRAWEELSDILKMI